MGRLPDVVERDDGFIQRLGPGSAVVGRSGSMFAISAAHRRDLFGDNDFADLFLPGRGRPSILASVMALVLELQTLHT